MRQTMRPPVSYAKDNYTNDQLVGLDGWIDR